MARKQQNDPLRYAANLTALAAAVYLGVTALLRLAVGQLLRLFNKSATLENPIAVPEWVLGVFNVLLPAAGLAAAFWLLAVGVRATPMRLRISVQMPRDGRLWLFVPVFLGAGFLCSLLTTLLQRLLAAFTRYRAPEAIRLPQSGFATFLYFIGMCVVPAVLEELLVRGAMQAVLSRWGTWFSIVVSSVVFTLLHGDIAQMPSLFILSVLMGLAAYCTGSLALGMALHFAYNTMSFLFYMRRRRWTACPPLRLRDTWWPCSAWGRGVSCGYSPPGRNAPFQAHPPGIRPQEPPEPSGAPGVCAAVPAGDGVHGAARGMAAVREIRKVGFIWMISR